MRLDARVGAGAVSGSAAGFSPGAPGASAALPGSGPPPPGSPPSLGRKSSITLPAGVGLPSLLQAGCVTPLAAGASTITCPAASLPASSMRASVPSGAMPAGAPAGRPSATASSAASAGAGRGSNCSAAEAAVSRPCNPSAPCPKGGRLTATRALAGTCAGEPASLQGAAAASPAAPGLSSASTADSSAAQVARGTKSCRRLGAGAGASAAGQRLRKRGRSSASSSSAPRSAPGAWPACSQRACLAHVLSTAAGHRRPWLGTRATQSLCFMHPCASSWVAGCGRTQVHGSCDQLCTSCASWWGCMKSPTRTHPS